MKRWIVIIFFAFLSHSIMAQIGGLSASKLASFTTQTVDYKKIEFEPGFYHSRSSKFWNSEGKSEDIFYTSDSVNAESGMYFRFTYGLYKNMEIGFSITSDLSISNLGFRYHFYQGAKFSMAALIGANIPLGNRIIDRRIREAGNLMQMGGGFVTTYDFTKNISLDFTGAYMGIAKETQEDKQDGYYLNMDLGYYILSHQLQIVGAAAYQFIKDDNGAHQVFSLNPGITLETGKRFIAVLSFPMDVYGKRATKNTAVNFALTLLFD